MARSKKPSNVVEQLKQAIRDDSRSQATIAARADISPQQLSRWMTGRYPNITSEIFARLCSAVGLKLQ